ncbi:MFS transporter [Amycolatopsis sp. CA-230715]|uniref:MFS transporter n=1 Tax=Amycolatopsis sp. CA-230715 TaxID=2745196 RepID=UPI001C02D23C|nr:MFS transporter [Amycolatopsis sp. CA-230715]QWF84816.1 Multidrug resistance protein Stp [Amycolatopsis sp. CA-230715]
MAADETEAPPAEAGTTPVAGRRRALALVVVLLGMLLDLLDITIVNVALPSIQRGLGMDGAAVQWVVASYTLAFAATLILGGRLGDLFGMRRMFLIGIVAFATVSALAGLAQNPEQLIVLRFVQGAAGAVMVPQVYSLIQVMYAPDERPKAWAGLSAVLAIGTVGGPLVGALITTADIAGLGWRGVFLVNVPLGIFAVVTALKVIPVVRGDSARKLDIPAAMLAFVALLCVVFPLVQGRELDWPAWVFVMFGVGVALLVIFVQYQRRRTADPLVPMSLFRIRSFVGGMLVSFFFMGGVMAFFLFITLHLQLGEGYSVLRAGFAGLPWDVAVPLFGALSAKWIGPKLGRTGMQLGLVLLIGTMLLFMWIIDTQDDVSLFLLWPPMFLGGVGMGLAFTQVMAYALNDVPMENAGAASGVVNTVYQVGVSLGIAACGTLLFALLAGNAQPSADSVEPGLRASLAEAGISGPAADNAVTGFRDCFAERMRLSEPEAMPPQCVALQELPPDAAGPIAAHDKIALRESFQSATVGTLWTQIGLFAAAFGATCLLPRRVEQH